MIDSPLDSPFTDGISQEPGISRRDVLRALSLLALVACPGAPALSADASSSRLAAFLRLSSDLTGENNLPPELAAQYLQVIEGFARQTLKIDLDDRLDEALMPPNSDAETLATSGQLDDAARARLAGLILDLWYGGVYKGEQGLVTVTWSGALGWTALGFTQAPGRCAGHFGFWSEEPSEQ